MREKYLKLKGNPKNQGKTQNSRELKVWEALACYSKCTQVVLKVKMPDVVAFKFDCYQNNFSTFKLMMIQWWGAL